MPNAKILSEKQAIVADLTEKIQGAAGGVLVAVSYTHLDVYKRQGLRCAEAACGSSHTQA